METKTILIIFWVVLYFIGNFLAFASFKQLAKKGFYRIPFIPIPKLFIKKHGQEVYDENKELINKILRIKWISTLSIIGLCVTLVWNKV